MQDFSEAQARCHHALDRLLHLAEQRNYKFDDYGTVWCPISVDADAPALKAPTGASFRGVLLHLYFPDGGENGLPMSLSAVAADILEFPNNDWLHSEFDRYARSRYRDTYEKDPSRCQPDERAFFDIYHQGGMDGKQLLRALATFDYFRVSPKSSNSYFYIPTSALRRNSDPRVAIPRSGASGATHRVSRSDLRHFLYLDVGAWSSPQRVPAQGSAAFGMISPDEVALWDLMAPKTNEHHPPVGRGAIVGDFLETGAHSLPGDLVFYARFFGDRFEMYRQGNAQRYHYRVPIPFTSASLMFLIPDLHLHMFPHSAADNFLEPWPGGQSLASYLGNLFDQIALFSRRHPVEVYQVGDCYELWESALLLCFAHGQGFGSLFTSIGASLSLSETLVEEYRDDLRREIASRKLDEIFSQRDVGKLLTVKWDDPSLRPIWLKMREAIERVQQISPKGRENRGARGLFTAQGRINADLADWTIVGGNHDSFVTDVTPIRRGVNDAIFIEHGHLRDAANAPAHILSGIFWTSLNAAAELKGVGDEAKNIEGNRREAFRNSAADTNLDPGYQYRKPTGTGPDHYSVIVTGHTHRQYVACLGEHPALPHHHETVAVFHETPWPGRSYSARLLHRGLDNVIASSSPAAWLSCRFAGALYGYAQRRK